MPGNSICKCLVDCAEISISIRGMVPPRKLDCRPYWGQMINGGFLGVHHAAPAMRARTEPPGRFVTHFNESLIPNIRLLRFRYRLHYRTCVSCSERSIRLTTRCDQHGQRETTDQQTWGIEPMLGQC